MKNLKIAAVGLALALSVGCFAGCGNKTTSGDGVTELTWWSGDSGSKAVMMELVDEFNRTTGKENNVKLVYDVQDEGANRLKVALQNGVEPDFFGVSNLAEFAENGYIVPLDEVPGIEETVQKNSEFLSEGSNVYGGKTYLLGVRSRLYGLAYNKDMFKAAGIVDENGEAKPPETLEEMIEDAKKLTDASKQQYGIILPLKWSGWYECEIGVNAQSSSGLSKGMYNVSTGEFDFNGIKPLASALLQMREDGSVYPGEEGMDNDPARARFAEGNVGMKFCVSWDAAVWNDQFKAKCDWGVAPAPSADKNTKYKGTKDASWSCAISKRNLTEKGPEKIALVYNWINSDEVQTKLCEAGALMPYRADIIENVDFSKAPKGWIDFADLLPICDDYHAPLPRDMSAYESDSASFINNVWSGKISLDDWIEERNDLSVKGWQKYKESHPDKDYSHRIIFGYDLTIQ